MHRIPYFTLLIGAFLFLASCQPDQILDPSPCEFSTDLNDYTLVWSDEFDGTEINTDTWTFQIGDGTAQGIPRWGNEELQYYTDRPENARVEGGNLIITARKENYQGFEYTSARMITQNKKDFRFGRIDVRAKNPRGKGLWPAIWMLSTEGKYADELNRTWPRSGEIDIMEMPGDKIAEIIGTAHYGFSNEDRTYVTSTYKPEVATDFSQDFHVYSLLWREDCFRFMVDGNLYGEAYNPSTTLPYGYPFNELFYLILNVAVGGNLPGNPDGNTVFPQEMRVDYVRVYQEN
jgi:beta-glucanase (GH16 family)